jgi:hypothetical protein
VQIVTAANDNKDYAELLEQCVSSAEELGYPVKVYDLGGLGHGNNKFADKEKKPVLVCRKKPSVILDALGSISPHELLVWADADCCFVDRIDEVDTKDYDVGLIERFGYFDQPVMSGVMFLYNTPQAVEFVTSWRDKIPKLPRKRTSLWKYGDQNYLNALMKTDPASSGVRIKYFNFFTYNNYVEEELDKAKIIHYKGGARSLRNTWREQNA